MTMKNKLKTLTIVGTMIAMLGLTACKVETPIAEIQTFDYTEERVEKIYDQVKKYNQEIAGFEYDWIPEEYADTTKISELKQTALKELKTIEDNFYDFHINGSADDQISEENKDYVNKLLANTSFIPVSYAIGDIEQIISRGRDVVYAVQSFEKESEKISQIYLPAKLLEQAQNVYNQGTEAIEERNYKDIRTAARELDLIKEKATTLEKQFNTLTNLYSQASNASNQDLDIRQAEDIYLLGQESIENLDVDSTKTIINQMQDLERSLNHRYRLQIN